MEAKKVNAMQSFLPEAGQNTLPCLLSKKKLAEAAAPALPSTVEEKKNFIKLLVRQLRKVESVLAHIGATYYFEVVFENALSVISPDNRVRKVTTEEPLPKASSDLKYLRRCVQKIMNEAYGRALGKEDCDPFPYTKHLISPVVKVSGMPEGVMFKHPSSYGVPKLKAILANKANIKMELITPSVAQDPAFCVPEALQTAVVQDIVMAEDPALCAQEAVETAVVQDIVMAEDPALCAQEAVETAVVQDIVVAEDPAFCIPEALQTAVVQDIVVAEDPALCAQEAVETAVVQDIQEASTSSVPHSTVKNSAKESAGKEQRTGLKTPWTAIEVLAVQENFSQELAGLKPVKRSSIESFLAQETVIKRTSAAVEKYLLRNRKKNRPKDQ